MYHPQSLYGKLEAVKSEIRLLRIIDTGKSDGAPVRCRLETVSLHTKPSFCALSYVWGDANRTLKILVASDDATEPDKEEEVAVTTNLEAALRHAPLHWANYRGSRDDNVDGSSFRLWADALCINQADNQERGDQVRMMASIYKAADLVISWLGPHDFGLAFAGISAILSEFIIQPRNDGKFYFKLRRHESQELTSLSWMGPHPNLLEEYTIHELSSTWVSMRFLLDNPYWRRIWIFQELVLAKELLLSTESSFLPWSSLAGWGSIMHSLRLALNRPSSRKPEWLSSVTWGFLTTDLLPLGRLSLVVMARKAMWMERSFQQRCLTGTKNPGDNELIWHRWDTVLTCTYRLHATHPRDYIFGLLGISNIPVEVDYTESISLGAIYAKFIQQYLEDTRARPRAGNYDKNWLAFLGWAGRGLPGSSASLPTWVPNFARKPQGARIVDLSVWMADKGVFEEHNNYCPFVDNFRLVVFGIPLEKVVFISEAPSEQTMEDGRMVGYMADFISQHPTYVSGIPPLLAFFSATHREPDLAFNRLGALKALSFFNYLVTVCRGSQSRSNIDAIEALGLQVREGPNEIFDTWFMRNFFPAAGTASHELDFDLLEELLKGPEGLIGEVWHRTMEKMMEIKEDWRFFETEGGYLGIGPEGIQVGDEVCVLKNSSVPVILRRKTGAGTEDVSHVGTAFVVGLMKGEAVKFKTPGKSIPERFELR